MSFGSVINRFGAFARGLYSPSALAGPEAPFPFQLESVRGVIEHHLALLITVGRADHELLKAERDVIVDHCRTILRRRDKLLSASEISVMEDFIEHFSPNASQLDAALRKFEAEGPDEFANLLAAADRVILADDVVREDERSQLAEIKKQFDQLHSKS
jgi:hypothetical protein